MIFILILLLYIGIQIWKGLCLSQSRLVSLERDALLFHTLAKQSDQVSVFTSCKNSFEPSRLQF